MVYNMEKIAISFHFGKIVKKKYRSLLPQRNHFIFPSRFSNRDFTLKKRRGSFSNTSAVLANIQQNLCDSAFNIDNLHGI